MQILNERSLNDAIDLLGRSEHSNIESVRIDWPELTELIRLANRFSNPEFGAISVAEDRCLSALGVWLSQLADGPIDAIRQTAGHEALLACFGEAISVGGASADIFQSQLQIITSIGSKVHPAAGWLEDWISAQPILEGSPDGPRAGQPATALVSKKESGRQAVEDWLSSENLFADAITYAGLKKAPAYENLVFFGPPSRYENSKWSSSPDSDYRAQWLLTAPAATGILLLNWPFHSRLDVSLLGPWKGVSSPAVIFRQQETHPEPPTLSVFNTPAFEKRATFNFDHEPDVVSAAEYQILGKESGLWVFFDENLGPRPRVLSRDLSRTSSPPRHKTLSYGSHLVFRSQDVERAQLLKVSEDWWSEKYKDFSFSRAEELRNELKERLQEFIDHRGVDQFRRGLLSSGLPREYVKQIHARVLDQGYVAPQSQDRYEALCRVLSYRAPPESFDLLAKLRTARQQAGLKLMRQLLEKLHSSGASGLSEALSDDGYAALHDDTLGELFITTVAHVSEGQRLFPISKLGRPVDEVGALWLK